MLVLVGELRDYSVDHPRPLHFPPKDGKHAESGLVNSYRIFDIGLRVDSIASFRPQQLQERKESQTRAHAVRFFFYYHVTHLWGEIVQLKLRTGGKIRTETPLASGAGAEIEGKAPGGGREARAETRNAVTRSNSY